MDDGVQSGAFRPGRKQQVVLYSFLCCLGQRPGQSLDCQKIDCILNEMDFQHMPVIQHQAHTKKAASIDPANWPSVLNEFVLWSQLSKMQGAPVYLA